MNIPQVGLLCLLVSICQGGKLRRRRQQCEDGTYVWGQIPCCRCPKGHYVKEHCSAEQTVCEKCVAGTFMPFPNSNQNCEPCKDCQSARGLEVAKECTDKTNAVCRCRSGFFCDKVEECFTCYSCGKCEGLGVKVPCTATNNTVCKQEQVPAGVLHGAIIAILVVAVVAGALVLWKKGYLRRCVKKTETTEEPEEMVPLSDDVDLMPYLPKIASVLKLQVVKNVARCSLTEAEIDRQEINHANNAEEQTYKLLEAWYQKQGESGACNALINALNEIGKKSDASHVERIIRDGEEKKMTIP